MRVLHIITGLRHSAGTSVFCVELCDHLKALGVETAIAVRDPADTDRYASRIGVPIVAMNRLDALAWRPDAAHIHGLWDWRLHAGARWCRRKGIPYVVSPHGMLAPWAFAFKRWKKRIAWRTYQESDLLHAALLHATAEAEGGQFRALGLPNPVVIAPLGVHVPDRPASAYDASATSPGVGASCRRVLFLGRIHPVKGLDNLVQAWQQIQPGLTERWQLVLAGPDDYGHRAEVETRARSLGLSTRMADSPEAALLQTPEDILFLGPVRDATKDAAYRSGGLFVLPSLTENFGAVVPEALAYGVPVIATKGTPWSELEGARGAGPSGASATGRCGWWIDIGVAPLAHALQEAMALTDAQRQVLGENGRRLVAEKYRWEAVAGGMLAAYAWMLRGGVPPPHVVLS